MMGLKRWIPVANVQRDSHGSTGEGTQYTLYYSPGTASMVVHLALLEIGVPYELRLVDVEQHAQRDPAYLKLNPQGVVPTLLIGGEPFVESAALLMMLAERHPEAGLAPEAGTEERNRWLQWMVYLSVNLGATYRNWFYPSELGNTQNPPLVRDALRRTIEAVWNRLDPMLKANGPYLLGAQFSAADLLLTMYMRWSRKMPLPALEWASLKELANLVRARPSWSRLYEIEGLTEWNLEAKP